MLAVALAAGLSLSASSCSSPDISCRVTTEDYTAREDGSVTYSASVTGSATIKSVVYQDGDKSVTVDSPKVPVSIKVLVASGAKVDITVYGSIENDAEGNILASYNFLDAAGADSYEFSSTCR